MKSIRTALILCTLLGAAGAANAQINMPDPSVPGATPDNAVRIVASSDLMVDRFIKRWLRSHYPDWDAEPYELTQIGMQRYAVVYITGPNNAGGRRVYFRLATSQADDDDVLTPSRF